jgi:hypothetical protein
MRKKGANLCQQNCDPLDEDNDFTLGVESQWPARTRTMGGNTLPLRKW